MSEQPEPFDDQFPTIPDRPGRLLPAATPEARPIALGHYEVLEKIADGGMGTVFKGRDRRTGELVAIKFMKAALAKNPVLLKRFEQEFRAASRLDHPNIVRGLDYGECAGRPYLVMEFVEGETLKDKIEREGRLPEKEAIRLIAQVAQGLHRAHKKKLIHRDVKPENILVTPDGIAKLADLGLVKELETDLNLTKTGHGLGTPHFMAPEQFRNARNADARADIYSLGATLYVMVTGELPFPGEPLESLLKKARNEFTPPREIVPDLSERTDRAICRALSVTPALRPATCREFIEDLTGHSTRRSTPTATDQAAQEIWYVKYVDGAGNLVTVKATVSRIQHALRQRALGDPNDVRVSRTETGPFVTLHAQPEFRDLLLPPRIPGRGNP